METLDSPTIQKPKHERGSRVSTEQPEQLLKKLDLDGVIPNKEKVLRTYQVLAEWYQLSEEFLNDEVNQTLLLGACQKLTESSDPIYRKRIKKFIKTLVAPTMGKERFDTREIFGKGGARGSMDNEAEKKYIDEVTDQEATEAFINKYQTQIEESKKAWLSRGYKLNIDTRIVSDSTINFKSNTGGTGFVNVPDAESLATKGTEQNVTFVLLKGVSDNEEFVRHELYHVQDYFDFIRRGISGTVLEGLDELHTEYAAENFRKDKNTNSGYFDLKNFWKDLSFMGDLDFDLISDRKKTMEEISENFGIEGMTIFSLQSAQSDGSFGSFEIFYRNPYRTVTEMLISKGKISARKAKENGELPEKIDNLPEILEKLKSLSIPKESRTSSKYKSIYDFITFEGQKTYSANFDEISSEDAKEMVLAYTQALAFAEIYHQSEIPEMKEMYSQIIDALGSLPYQMSSNIENLSAEDYIAKRVERDIKYFSSEEDLYTDIYSKLFYNLTKEQQGVDIAFSLENPTTKNQILEPFYRQLDGFAKACLKRNNPKLTRSFIEGFFGYILTSELRDSSLDYLKSNNPELVEIIEEVVNKTDTKKLKAVSI